MNKNTIPTPAQVVEIYEIMLALSDIYNAKITKENCYRVDFRIANDAWNIGETYVELSVSKHFKDSETGEDKCELIENISNSTHYITVNETISLMREAIERAKSL